MRDVIDDNSALVKSGAVPLRVIIVGVIARTYDVSVGVIAPDEPEPPPPPSIPTSAAIPPTAIAPPPQYNSELSAFWV